MVFLELESTLGSFSIGLFASRTNAELETYCSWGPDAGVRAVDALPIPWTHHHSYMFPPFTLIPWCLGKFLAKETSAVLIALLY